MREWDWEIMTDRHPHETDICSRLAEREKEGWTVVAICETDAGSGFYKVFMRREMHPSGSLLVNDPRKLWPPEHREIYSQRCASCGVRPGELHLKNCPVLKETK